MNNRDRIADDLFAGSGGWDLAAHALGIHARGVENMTEARATREAAGLATVHDDVWTFRPKYTARDGGLHLQAEGLIASPPCQTFSQAGKGSGRKALDAVLALLPDVEHLSLADLQHAGKAFGDDRTGLVLTPLWFALHHPYRWLAWEQVPAVLPVWEACAEALREHGWHAWAGYLHAEQYGVPQTRKRAFLLASRDHEVHPPTPTHSRYHSRTPSRLDSGVQKWVSMAEALGWTAREGEARVEIRRSQERINEAFDPASGPAQAVTSRVNRWQIHLTEHHPTGDPCTCPDQDERVHTGQNSRQAGGTTIPFTRSTAAPAPTVTGQARSWRIGGDVVGFPRRPERLNTVTWEPRHAPDEPCDCPVTFTATNDRPHVAHRTPCQPAPTLAFGHETPRWNPRRIEDHPTVGWTADRPALTVTGDPRIPRPGHKGDEGMHGGDESSTVRSDEVREWLDNPRETTPDGLPRFAQQSDNPIDFEWPDNRPATVVAGREIVQAPGATANRHNGSTKSRNDGVRVSIAEAGILQSFPADYPWTGTKTKQFLQAGNAIPPLLGYHALTAVVEVRPS